MRDILEVRETKLSASLTGDFISKIQLQHRRIQDIGFVFAGVTRQGSVDPIDISIAGGTASQIGWRPDVSTDCYVDGRAKAE